MKSRRDFLKIAKTASLTGIIASGISPAILRAQSSNKSVSLEQAWDVHKKCHIIDGHDDTLVTRVAVLDENPLDWMK